MKFGEKALKYNWKHFNKSDQIIKILNLLNEMLGKFTNQKGTGPKYGFYLLANSVLICAQSLFKAIRTNDSNLLGILVRQSMELMINCKLILDDMGSTDLEKLRTKERLKVYAGYCLWWRLNQLEILMDKKKYKPGDKTEIFTDKQIEDSTITSSIEFHLTKDIVNRVQLNLEISMLNKRSARGENIYSFHNAIRGQKGSYSSYSRDIFSAASHQIYSELSSRLHGSWLSAHVDEKNTDIIKSSLKIPSLDNSDTSILIIIQNLNICLWLLSAAFNYLWPSILKKGRMV